MVQHFCVATLDEAIELRMHGVDAKLLVLGVVPTEDIEKAIQHRVALTVPSKAWLKETIKQIPDDNQKFMATCKIRYWYGPNWNERYI